MKESAAPAQTRQRRPEDAGLLGLLNRQLPLLARVVADMLERGGGTPGGGVQDRAQSVRAGRGPGLTGVERAGPSCTSSDGAGSLQDVAENVWIGDGATTVPGVTIVRDAVVAAGAIVVGDVPAAAW